VRSFPKVLILALLLSSCLTTTFGPQRLAGAQTPAHIITWDSHSLLLDGKRLMLYSGEFHYWRLPAPAQWTDRLEKIQAAGLNAVSLYFDWQYHSAAPGVYDFSGIRDVGLLLDEAQKLGLYVIARVGPYMNAETDAGGLPGWLLTKQLSVRAQSWDGVSAHPSYSPLYTQYSKEWYDHLLPILARHQVTTGGPVILLSIENEYNQVQGSEQYMRDLISFARADGITVPIFHNDFNFRGDWSTVVDLYAYDSYPYGFNCCHEWNDTHFQGVDTWESVLRSNLKLGSPMFVSEMQGGSFDPWHGVGYSGIAQTFGGDWLTALDQSAFAQGTTILNTYMFAGGTSWGYMGEPGVYSSYDYGAPISEAGVLRPAYYAAHRIAMFLQTYGQQLAGSDAAVGLVSASDSSVVVHTRLDATSGQAFIFLRHGNPGPSVRTRLTLNLGGRIISVPQKQAIAVTIPGHGAEMLTANASVGPLHLDYSTSQVLTSTATAGGNYLVLYGPTGSWGETEFAAPAGPMSVEHNFGVEVHPAAGLLRLDYRHTVDPRTIRIQTSAGVLHVLITTDAAAGRYWVADHMLISGPALVTADAQRLTLWSRAAVAARIYGDLGDRTIEVDGRLTARPDSFLGAVSAGTLAGPVAIELPTLNSWKFSPESPETSPTFDDSSWLTADHSTTANPNVPATSTLLADDYGFHYGFVWYRGHFNSVGTEPGMTLLARQSYDVYLNGEYIGSGDESLADPPHPYAIPRFFGFPPKLLRPGMDNVISVLTESLGHDQGWAAGPLAQSPQGIISAQVGNGVTPIVWKIQGAAGGEQSGDQVRGPMNASGLFGERHGWYLPGFDDSGWQSVSVPDDWAARGEQSRVGWYRAHFTLHRPSGSSQPLGLLLPHVSDKAVIWLNGWLIGRYWEQRGPQHLFYLPEGVLNPDGKNVLAIAVWDRGHQGGLVSVPQLVAYPGLQSYALSEGPTAAGQGAGYWHTSGNQIVDSLGRPVRIAAVNWSGMQNVFFVPAGLDRQPLAAIVQRVHDLGFNAIRLPFSNQLVESNPVVTTHLDANPNLQGLHALDIMDRVIAAARSAGLRVILEDHRSDAGTDPQENGLWYTTQYPESSWIRDWKTLSHRYQDDPTVVGIDLRNEPHTGPPGPWSQKTYLTQGATWGPYHGVENTSTDWRLAAKRGGDAVLSVNPRLLIFVEGIQQYPDPSLPGGVDSYWWGGVLQPARRYPVVLSLPHRLVYSPHEYGPQKYQMPFFGPAMTYRGLTRIWEKHWGFLEESQYGGGTPIFIGEFGTCGASPACVSSNQPGSQGLWFSYFLRYLREHPEIGWSYWALNGTNPQGNDQGNYILKNDWRALRLHQLIDALRDVETTSEP
jgi:beta-galactosidase GanA/aryl-phospho-beta-D-glucosidase BglC (GH1 family)